jgi:prepilin-type N-terminal cleavage/methylation domain-containing protein
LFRKRLREESGYTLIEVMVAIIILAVAILPMFDMGLNAATQSSHYDKARTLANLKMEEAKSMPFVDVKDNFPVDGSSTPDTATGYYDSGFIPESGPASADFTNFEYRVEKQYMQQPPADSEENPADPTVEFLPCDPTSTEPNVACDPDTGLIRVTVTVQWDDPVKTYTTFGLVAE